MINRGSHNHLWGGDSQALAERKMAQLLQYVLDRDGTIALTALEVRTPAPRISKPGCAKALFPLPWSSTLVDRSWWT